MTLIVPMGVIYLFYVHLDFKLYNPDGELPLYLLITYHVLPALSVN